MMSQHTNYLRDESSCLQEENELRPRGDVQESLSYN